MADVSAGGGGRRKGDQGLITTYTELWRFDLDNPHIRTMIAYGGKLDFDSHFLPMAQKKAVAEGLRIVDVDRNSFRFDVKMNNTYAVMASVTVEDQ